MKKAAVGFRVHSGWAAMVSVSVEKDVPVILGRQRLQLVETFSYKVRQPYHTAEKMPIADAGKFIDRVRAEAKKLAYQGLMALRNDLEKRGYRLERGGLLLASGRPLPELVRILLSHALIHTADGELFRQALRDASARSGLSLDCTRERDLLTGCVEAFSTKTPQLLRRVRELGRPLGSPWSQDQKFSMLAAWLALVRDLPSAS